MTDLDEAMAQAIQQFQSGNKVGGMFDLAHAGGCDRLDRKHASGLVKGYSAHAIYTAMCEALWEHGEEPLADVVQRVHHKLAGKTAVSTEPKPKLSEAKDTALAVLEGATFGFKRGDVLQYVTGSLKESSEDIIESVLKQLGAEAL